MGRGSIAGRTRRGRVGCGSRAQAREFPAKRARRRVLAWQQASRTFPKPRHGVVRYDDMAYRDDLTALSARHDALAAEVTQKTRELDDARRLLEQAHARAKLPVLDNLRVAAPCTADWNQMTGDERTRHCGDCKKNVYNLTGMTREEAEALVIEKNGDLCVRYFQRHDGTILLADCEIGVKRRRRRRRIATAAAALLAGGAAAVGLRVQHERVTGRMLMGSVAIRDIPQVIAEPTVESPRPADDNTHPPTIPTTPKATHAPGQIKMGRLVRVD
jgi:hypothetical protein